MNAQRSPTDELDVPRGVRRIQIAEPPCDNALTLRTVHAVPATLAIGGAVILTIDLEAFWTERDDILDVLVQLRRTHPGLMLVSHVERPLMGVEVPLLRLLATAGLRVVVSGPFEAEKLRHSVRASGLSGVDLRFWWTHRLRIAAPDDLAVIDQLIGVHAMGRSVQGRNRTRLRKTLRAMDLPWFEAWRNLYRVLTILLHLQTEPAESATHACKMYGLHDMPSFHHRCQALFLEAPGTLRTWLGWEGLLERFLVVGRQKAERVR